MRKAVLIATLISALPLWSQTEITFYINQGDFVVELYDSIMPVTTTNFINLVNNKGYDGKEFYRVIDNFVIQGGYRTGLPPSIPDEFDSSGVLSNTQWTISMANSGPNTGSSEFFINLVNNTFLDYDKPPLTSAHPVFGKVTSGVVTVFSIGKVATDGNDEPVVPVVMDSLRVTSAPLQMSSYSSNELRASVYPNPLHDNSILSFDSPVTGTVYLKLFDAAGRLIRQTSENVQIGSNDVSLDILNISSLNSGIYLLNMQLNGEQKVIMLRCNKN